MLCCCPKKNISPKDNSIDQKLIEVPNSPKKTITQSKRGVLSQSDKKKQSSNFSEKSLPLSHVDKTTNYHQNKLNLSHQLNDQHNIGQKPFFYENTIHPKNSGNGSKLLIKNKGQLFEFQHNTQVVYFDTKKQDEFCVRYLINKKPNTEKQTKSILNYVLAKRSQKSNQQTQLILIVPSKVLYETKHMQIPSNVYAIFTNMRRLQKNNSSNNSDQIIQIIDGDQGSIKAGAFDKIIVILQGEQDIDFIKNYCKQLAKRYTLDQFIKIWWVLPSFLNLQDISDIIKQTLRKFVINDKVQNIAKYLYYQVDVIKQLNLQPFLLVKNKRWKDFKDLQTKKHSKDYESQICMAIGLLMVQMNQTVLPYYKYFLQNTLFEMKLLDYIKYKSILQNQKQNFFKKLLFYNLVTQDGAKVLQENRKMIEYKYENAQHRRFCIKHTAKKKYVAAFGFQQSIQTGDGNTPIKQQWDDNIKLEDLQVRKGSWDKQSGDSPDNDLNLIDEQDLDKILITDLINLQNDEPTSSNQTDETPQFKQHKNEQEQKGQIDINILETNQINHKQM